MAESMIVVGAGVVGTALAWCLQAEGAPTTLVDDARPGASYGSFASLSSLDEPLSEVYSLRGLGMSLWRRWDRELEHELGLTWDGEIRWAENPEAAEVLRRKVKRATRRGYPVRLLSRSELAERLPGAALGEVLEASLAPDDGQADPPRAIARIRQAFEELGGRVLTGEAALDLATEPLRVAAAGEELEAGRVVVAGGARTRELLGRLGWELPLDPSPGLLAVTEPVAELLTGTVYVAPSRGTPIHLRQLADGRVLVGERSQEHVARRPTAEHARGLLAQAARSFPALEEVAMERFTLDYRPMPRDGLPVVGALPGLPEVHVATAHAGVTLAPAIATLLAAELVHGRPQEKLAPCRPGRFAERQTDLAYRVEEAFGML